MCTKICLLHLMEEKCKQHYLPIHLVKTEQCSQSLQTQDHKQGNSIKILLPIHNTKIPWYFGFNNKVNLV